MTLLLLSLRITSCSQSEKSKSVYLVGSNNVTYNSYIDEISSTLYEIPANYSRTYKIKFNKIYSLGVKTTKIVFSDIVSDFEKYKQTLDEIIQSIENEQYR